MKVASDTLNSVQRQVLSVHTSAEAAISSEFIELHRKCFKFQFCMKIQEMIIMVAQPSKAKATVIITSEPLNLSSPGGKEQILTQHRRAFHRVNAHPFLSLSFTFYVFSISGVLFLLPGRVSTVITWG